MSLEGSSDSVSDAPSTPCCACPSGAVRWKTIETVPVGATVALVDISEQSVLSAAQSTVEVFALPTTSAAARQDDASPDD